jgi:hypothetical protein
MNLMTRVSKKKSWARALPKALCIISVIVFLPLLLSSPTAQNEPSAHFRLSLYYYDAENMLVKVNKSFAPQNLEQFLGKEPSATSLEICIGEIVSALIEPPTEPVNGAMLEAHYPSGAKLDSVKIDDGAVSLYFTFPAGTQLSDPDIEMIIKQTVASIEESLGQFKSILFFAQDVAASGYNTLDKFLPPQPPIEKKPVLTPKEAAKKPPTYLASAAQYPSYGQGQPTGALTAKSVFLSQGHGWYWTGSSWTTQRGNYGNLIEDLHNAEWCDYFISCYFYNAGAGVYTCRERCVNTNEPIIDNDTSGYSETGTWTASTSTSGYYGSDYKVVAATPTETATARYTPTFPADGWYAVYAWWTGGTNRASDVQYRIYHTGGLTTVIQNQQRDAFTWKCLGQFYFNAGASDAQGSVIISNQSNDTSAYVIADAMRFGGGMGTIDRGGGISGKPRYEECSRYYAQFMGAPASVYDPSTSGDNTDDVTCRPRYAEWEKESWEDGIYISNHTNALDGTISGTSSFAQSSAGWDGAFDGTAGSLELRNYLIAR